MGRRFFPLWLAAATCCAALLPGVARADDPVPVTETELTASGGWGAKEGKLVELLNVKFRDSFGSNVRLVKLPSDKLVLDTDARQALATNLASWKTSTGALDKKGRSNVRVVGVARTDSQAGRVIDVHDVTKLPDDVEAFKRRFDVLATGDADGRTKLADEARRRADFYSLDDLRDWSRSAYDSALDVRRAALAKGDSKGAIELAQKYRELAGATNKAITLLGDLVVDPATAEADRDRGIRILESELGAVLHRGRWVSRDDFKAALGFLPRRDAAGNVSWVRRERVEFEAVVAAQRQLNRTDPNPRKLLGSQYEEAAKQGEPVVGMYKQEVVRTKGLGFPSYVDRFSEKNAGGEISWDQWIMPDGARFYFMAQGTNWVMIASRKKDEPLPQN